MHLCLFEDDKYSDFRPLVNTRGVFDLRIGASTIAEAVQEQFKNSNVMFFCRPSVSEVMARDYDALVNHIPDGLDVLFLNARWLPTRGVILDELTGMTNAGAAAHIATEAGETVAALVPSSESPSSIADLAIANGGIMPIDALRTGVQSVIANVAADGEPVLADSLWTILDQLQERIADDFQEYSAGFNIYERPGTQIDENAILVKEEWVFLGKGTTVSAGAILNATDGPIIIGPNVQIRENAVVKGPVFVGRNSIVKVGANIARLAIGESCKVAGEIHDVIIHSFSNKGHAGYLGNSYVGSWCNLGAGTSNSNLRNDYSVVSVFNYQSADFVNTGRTFAGLIMGDHSKCGIGTTFNTGTVVGTSCNLFGAGFHPKFVPSFCWGSPDKYSEYRLAKAEHVAKRVMGRRNREFEDVDQALFRSVLDESETHRSDFLKQYG